MKYEIHPAACIFPMLDEKAFEKLKEDIEKNGIEEMGVLYQGMVLDGRNRYRAAQELGVEMNWSEIEPEDATTFDPLQYVLTHNLHRRHLKQSQRAMIAAKMATLREGRPNKTGSNELVSQDEAASLLSVSVPTLKRAKHVLEHGSKALIDAVEACEVTVSLAEKLCKVEPDKRKQSQLVKEGKDTIRMAVNPTPHEQPEEVEEMDEDDKYDHPVVKSFKTADYKMNTLRKIVSELSEKERKELAKWLNQ